jgi:hypothetical protein
VFYEMKHGDGGLDAMFVEPSGEASREGNSDRGTFVIGPRERSLLRHAATGRERPARWNPRR